MCSREELEQWRIQGGLMAGDESERVLCLLNSSLIQQIWMGIYVRGFYAHFWHTLTSDEVSRLCSFVSLYCGVHQGHMVGYHLFSSPQVDNPYLVARFLCSLTLEDLCAVGKS